jgi:glycosyltransferase involved in cell wall biosynthesis
MALLTVFTPTYNRKDTLKRTYESLKRQTLKDFVWLIIDDGSIDDTGAEVERWQQETAEFEIRYCYKENGGLHTGYNKAIELADTELMICIDSDDYMPDNAVELICNKWHQDGSEHLGGIIGLDFYMDGAVVGNRLPLAKTLNLVDVCVGKIDIHGDKKQVVRTECFRKVAPMPVFKGEKNFNPYYMILKIGKEYEFLALDENLCFVDYQKDGMTANQWKQYWDSPNSFAEIRRLYLSLDGGNFPYYFKQAIHYVSSCLIAKRKGWIQDSPRKFVTFIAAPLGFGLKKVVEKKAGK